MASPKTPKPEPETGAASARVRCGVAGVGSLGQHHARIYASLPAAELAGIYETNDARAEEICAQYHCRRFATLEELGEACDAVSVVVPTDRHAAVALPLLAQGCHLLIEKPLCASLAEAAEVLAAAQAHGCLVQVGHIEHFNPVMGFLEKAVTHPGYITTERLAPYQPRGTEVGVVLDLMIHDIGIVLALVKAPIRRIDSVGINLLSKTEDIANARIEFAERLRGQPERQPHEPEENARDPRVPGIAYLSLDFMNQSGPPGEEERHASPTGEAEARPGEAGRRRLHSGGGDSDREGRAAGDRAGVVSWTASRKARQPKVGAALGKSALEVAIAITEQIRTAHQTK